MGFPTDLGPRNLEPKTQEPRTQEPRTKCTLSPWPRCAANLAVALEAAAEIHITTHTHTLPILARAVRPKARLPLLEVLVPAKHARPVVWPRLPLPPILNRPL